MRRFCLTCGPAVDPKSSACPVCSSLLLPTLPQESGLGHLQLNRLMASHPMRSLFEAQSPSDKTSTLVHIYRVDWNAPDAQMDRLGRVFRNFSAIQQPHTVTVSGYAGAADSTVCLITTRPAGVPLRSLLDLQGLMEPPRTLRLLADIARALQSLHERGIVHGILTPESVWVVNENSRERAVLVDFGTGESPVQPEGIAPISGIASDIHALAALAWEMLSGARLFSPHDAPGPLHLLVSSGNQNLPPLPRMTPHELESTLRYALTRGAEGLWPTPGSLAEGLDRAYRRAGRTRGGTAVLGEQLWRTEAPAGVIGSPVLVDIDRDHRHEVVVGYETGWIYCHTADGELRWRQPLRAETGTIRPMLMAPATVEFSPTSGPEVLAMDRKGTLYAFASEDGHPLWTAPAFGGKAPPRWPAPAVGDLNHDGEPEFLLSLDSQIDGRGNFRKDAHLVLLEPPPGPHGDPTTEPGARDLPRPGPFVLLNQRGQWRAVEGDEVPLVLPRTPEPWLVVRPRYLARREAATQFSYHLLACTREGEYAWETEIVLGDDSMTIPPWGFGAAPPVAADVDGDGRYEIVVAVRAQHTALICLDDAGRQKWETQIDGQWIAEPVIADLNGDGRLEILTGAQDRLLVFDGAGQLIDERQISGRPGPAVVGDLDVDGWLEIVVGTDTGDLVCIVAGPCEWGEIPWPKYRRTVWNWGVVPMNK
jgi:outer membrane protein assembly factor BamB